VIAGVPKDAGRVLELGAGTGNVTRELLRRGYRVTALENNPFMLEKMAAKRLGNIGNLTVNMESVEQLDLIDQRNFDAAVAVNVVYALEDPFRCFRKVANVLTQGGVFAFSTTHSETRLEPLLTAIANELKSNGTFAAKEEHYQRVVEINKDIQISIARRHSREQYELWLEEAGFKINHIGSSYKDAVLVFHARKQ